MNRYIVTSTNKFVGLLAYGGYGAANRIAIKEIGQIQVVSQSELRIETNLLGPALEARLREYNYVARTSTLSVRTEFVSRLAEALSRPR